MSLFDKFKKRKKEEVKKSEVSSSKNVKQAVKLEVKAKEKPVAKVVKKEVKPSKVSKVNKEDTKEAYRILIKPIISERATFFGAVGKYIFEVSPRANKIEIKKAMKSLYGVSPMKVNIINVSGKETTYGRTRGRTKNWKKAIVTLQEGDKIELVEGV